MNLYIAATIRYVQCEKEEPSELHKLRGNYPSSSLHFLLMAVSKKPKSVAV